MGRQIGFYAVGEDYESLLRYAEEIGLKALPEIIPSDTEMEAVSPTMYRLLDDQDFFYLFPDKLGIGEAIYVEIDSEPGFAKLNASASPVIELAPCQQTGGRVYNGRIYLGLERDDEFYSVMLKHFNMLTRYIRDWVKTDRFGFYVGPHTADLARQGAIKLMHHQVELHLA